MAINPLYIKQDDLQPYYYAQVKDASDTAVDITGATIYCTMRLIDDNTRKIDKQHTGILITDAAAGKFVYKWQRGDTDTSGIYSIEFEVHPTTGGQYTVPANQEAIVEIKEQFDIYDYVLQADSGEYFINGSAAQLTKA